MRLRRQIALSLVGLLVIAAIVYGFLPTRRLGGLHFVRFPAVRLSTAIRACCAACCLSSRRWLC